MTWQAGRARTDAKTALVRLRRQAKICMKLAHKLYREGWCKG